MRFAICDDQEIDLGKVYVNLKKYLDKHLLNVEIDLFSRGEALVLSPHIADYDLVLLDVNMESAALIKQQMENQVKTTQALMKSHEKQRKLTHDFKHHASVVKNLLEMGEVAQAEDYLEKISHINRINELVVSSGHPIVDTVLNQKYSEAKQQNIEVEFILSDLSNLSLANEDIVILLANLLDNAIEGCMKVEKTRLIRVRIQKEENAALVVGVGNSAATSLEFNEETIQTDKPDSLLHGYGFQNIREVLLKYDAVPAVECKNGWFQFSTVIY